MIKFVIKCVGSNPSLPTYITVITAIFLQLSDATTKTCVCNLINYLNRSGKKWFSLNLIFLFLSLSSLITGVSSVVEHDDRGNKRETPKGILPNVFFVINKLDFLLHFNSIAVTL